MNSPALIDSTPQSPYFTIPITWHFSDKHQKLGEPPHPRPPKPSTPKPITFTIKSIFGSFKEMSDTDQAMFLLTLMKHVKIDWSAACTELAKEYQIRPVKDLRERLRMIAGRQGFTLGEKNKITGGVVPSKDLLGKPRTDSSSSKMPKVTPEKTAKRPQTGRKLKNGDSGTEMSAAKEA